MEALAAVVRFFHRQRSKMDVQLQRCCCGCSLRTGTKIIAGLSMIAAILTIIYGVLCALCGAAVMEQVWEATPDRDRTAESVMPSFFVILTVLITTEGTLKAVVSGKLLEAVNKDRPRAMKPWIICSIFEIVIQCIATLLYVVGALISGHAGLALLQLLVSPCVISIAVYNVLIVRSYRRELILSSMSPKI